MKKINFLKVATIFMGLTLLFNACSEDPVAPPVAPPIVKPITTIADLKAMWVDADITIAEEVYIKGVVTLTPLEKNIPDFVTYIQDATGGIAITLDKDSYNILEAGMEVIVGGTGIQLKKFNGLHQFGNLKLETGYLVSKDNVVTPKVVTLADVLAGKYIGELVEIKDVEFEKAGTFNGTSGNNTLTDCTSKATVYTRSACTFAAEALPAGNGSFVGVVSVYNTPQLLVRTPSDLVMTGERCGGSSTEVNTNVCGDTNTPQNTIIEMFNDAVVNQSFEKEGWRNVMVQGDRNWSGKEFNSNKYIQATAHNAAAGTYETWLITPPMDVTNAANKTLSFKTAQAYWKESTTFEVFVLKCENGATTQTKLSPVLATSTTANYEFVSSGDVDLSQFTGIIHIGFKYVAEGGASNSTTWCIDDVEFNNTVTSVNFTSSAVTSVASGAAYQYDITTQVMNGVGATTISATGLPAWATLTDNGDGTATITGTAPTVTEDQSSEVEITATNNSISQTQNYTLTVKAPTAEGTNLVVNPGFEDWDAALPTGWDNAYNFNVSKETTIKHSGSNAIKHTYVDKTAKIQQEIEITGGKTYEISYWYLDNDVNAKSRMWTFWLAGTNTITDNEAEFRPADYSTDNANWVQVKHTLVAPATATKLRFEVRTYKGTAAGGFIYYDDFSVIEK